MILLIALTGLGMKKQIVIHRRTNMGMLIITGIWSVILIGIFVIGLAIDKLILKILDKEQKDGTNK